MAISSRKRRSPKSVPNLDILLLNEVRRVMAIQENGRKKRLLTSQIIVRQLVNKAISGDMKVIAFIYEQQRHFPKDASPSLRLRKGMPYGDLCKMSYGDLYKMYMRMLDGPT